MLLKSPTPTKWTTTVLGNFDKFLAAHAYCELKAGECYFRLASRFPVRTELVRAMIDLGTREIGHYRDVQRILDQRKIPLPNEPGSAYALAMIKLIRKSGTYDDNYLMDRLLVASIFEARAYERLSIVAKNVSDPELQDLYQGMTSDEEDHRDLFQELATTYFGTQAVQQRLDALVNEEAQIFNTTPLPLRPL